MYCSLQTAVTVCSSINSIVIAHLHVFLSYERRSVLDEDDGILVVLQRDAIDKVLTRRRVVPFNLQQITTIVCVYILYAKNEEGRVVGVLKKIDLNTQTRELYSSMVGLVVGSRGLEAADNALRQVHRR